MRRYYLHSRHNGVFYAELVEPQTGRKLTARSTGTKNRDEALLKIAEWLKTGIPTGEVLALKREDIEERTLNARHSWRCIRWTQGSQKRGGLAGPPPAGSQGEIA